MRFSHDIIPGFTESGCKEREREFFPNGGICVEGNAPVMPKVIMGLETVERQQVNNHWSPHTTFSRETFSKA